MRKVVFMQAGIPGGQAALVRAHPVDDHNLWDAKYVTQYAQKGVKSRHIPPSNVLQITFFRAADVQQTSYFHRPNDDGMLFAYSSPQVLRDIDSALRHAPRPRARRAGSTGPISRRSAPPLAWPNHRDDAARARSKDATPPCLRQCTRCARQTNHENFSKTAT